MALVRRRSCFHNTAPLKTTTTNTTNPSRIAGPIIFGSRIGGSVSTPVIGRAKLRSGSDTLEYTRISAVVQVSVQSRTSFWVRKCHGSSGNGTWSLVRATGKGGAGHQRLAFADDLPGSANGSDVLGYDAAAKIAMNFGRAGSDGGTGDAPDVGAPLAVLAGNAGLPDSDFRVALERAVALKPDFDDARYMLALILKNAGEYDAAVGQLRAMRHVAPVRAYHYWMAMASALVELDRREEAVTAAKHAAEHTSDAAERRSAEQLAYIAETDLAVQFTKDL